MAPASVAATASTVISFSMGGLSAAPRRKAIPSYAGAVKRLLEIRSYNLKPGTLDEFHRLVVEQSMPMLQRWGVDVVAYGPSPHDPDSYFLMRAYADDTERQASQHAFYGSDEWRSGPRQAVLDCIESDATISLELDTAIIDGLRSG
jgi:hypothetical protein